MVNITYARWIAASTIGFGVAGIFIRFLAPTAAVVGGLLGLVNGPFILLATQSELKDMIAWSITLTGGVATGCVVGVLTAGCAAFFQAWIVGLTGQWLEASLKGGVLGGALAGAAGALLIGTGGGNGALGLPMDWVFLRSSLGILALASTGGILGGFVGGFQREALELGGFRGSRWPVLSTAAWAIAWGLSGVYGETLLRLIGTAPEAIVFDRTIAAATSAVLRSEFEPHISAALILALVGMMYGGITVHEVQHTMSAPFVSDRAWRFPLSGRVAFVALVGCGLVELITLVAAWLAGLGGR